MRHDDLRERVCAANLSLPTHGLVRLTWGNVSEFDREDEIVAIKPSGVPYDRMTPADMVLLRLDGTVVAGDLRPSSDTPTHLAIYRAFDEVSGVVHTHSTHATALCQVRRELPCLGTTHADHFAGTVPLTRQLTPAEVAEAYEANTGRVIVEAFADRGLSPTHVPAVLVAGHGPFTWGTDGQDAVHNAVALDACAEMTLLTGQAERDLPPLEPHLLDKHHTRKHGPRATYGQADPHTSGAPR
ncbi:L-ribulose-5-phosphate 4-epimerase AraD [Euzebya sp.]|uniref:L-ribulose-5-phosphate 4-epimerase AraD n=1 Tax=Euzebya sp. TaxID=1971409 RepID=UPI003518B504